MSAESRVRAALNGLLSGEHATKGRDFGRGVAHAARVIQAALDSPGDDTCPGCGRPYGPDTFCMPSACEQET